MSNAMRQTVNSYGAGKPLRKEDDYYGWLLDQARRLRSLAVTAIGSGLDCAELAEELEGMARSDEHAVESHLQLLLMHLLKWQYQSGRRAHSWSVSIRNARTDIRNRLLESPSLKSKLPVLIERAYEKARRSAGAEMNFDEREWDGKSPSACPWTFDTFMGDFWPDEPAAVRNG